MNYCVSALILTATIVAVRCCSSDADCPTPDTICVEDDCSCRKGYFLNVNGTQCLPYVTEYYADCSEDAQCEWLGENSECNYVCQCQEGYRWYQGQCMKYVGLGGKCSNNLECFDGYDLLSQTCLNETCTCSDDYYPRGDTDCRKKAQPSGICALNVDCQDGNTVCHVGKCLPPSTNSFKELQEGDEDIEETHFPYQVTAETTCESDTNCSTIENSECYQQTGTCVCKKQYFFDPEGTKCVAELGVDVECSSDSDCPIRPGKCVDGACYCRDYYFVDAGNRNCVKTISENNWNCLSKEWCYALGPHSFCSSVGSCNCSSNANFDQEHELCTWNGETDPDMCIWDAECKYIEDGLCVDEHCGCKLGYVVEGNKCITNGGIGDPCSKQTDCKADHSECQNEKCLCVENYAAFGNSCYPIIHNLGDKCEINVQCANGIADSGCIDGKCACTDQFIPYDNICYEKKYYGSYCNNLQECEISSIRENIACRRGICQCPTGYTVDDKKCSSGSILIGNLLIVATVMILKRVF